MSQGLLIEGPEEYRRFCNEVRESGGTLGFVPTMGALHEGHLALVRRAAQECSAVAVSIFVNPTQFGPTEDLAKYPRTLDADLEACSRAGVRAVFLPRADQMYPAGERTRVRVSGLQDFLCGASRPGHFDGVTTIVAKLFGLTGPCTAVFGRKDYQQLKIIERMTLDLLLPVKVIGHPIVRDPDGLALSSRNVYLSAAERERALTIVRALGAAREAACAGASSADVTRAVTLALTEANLRVDYVEVADANTLVPVTGAARGKMLLVAVFCGSTRLIDNVLLDNHNSDD